ncbi:MAG TPA: hypothetical protein VFW19_08165 [Allosphingosinicella sp.]|nr:hypothetical protein [Allosphingosinicella sp.]
MIVRTTKLPDKDLLALIAELFRRIPSGSASLTIGEGVTTTIKGIEDIDAYQFDTSGRLIESFNFHCQPQEPDTVAFHRGTTVAEQLAAHGIQAAFNKVVPSAYFDELAFYPPRSRSGNYQPLSDQQRISVAQLLNSFAAPIDAASDDDARQLSKVVSKQIDDLRRLNLKMTEGLAEARQKDEEAFRARQVELDESFKVRLDQLTEKEAELEQRRRELNDREPQHERRRLREHLTARLQSTIAEPPPTTGRRERYSHYLYLIAAALFIGISLSLSLSTELGRASGSAAFWALSAKSLVAGAVGAALTWAGLSGLKSSAVSARQYEQAIQRYAFDMDRASWVVETILQMNSVEKSEVPDEWLEAVCRDLFVTTVQKPEDNRSLEAFAALFDATAKARIGTNGLEFEIDRKGAKKLAQD